MLDARYLGLPLNLQSPRDTRGARLLQNRAEQYELTQEERLQRGELSVLEEHMRLSLRQGLASRLAGLRRGPVRNIFAEARLAQRQANIERLDHEEEALCQAEGKARLEEQKRLRKLRTDREAILSVLKELEAAQRGARVFVVGEEAMQRRYVADEEHRVWLRFAEAEQKQRLHLVQLDLERREKLDAAQRAELEEQTRLEAQQQAAALADAERKREQEKLIRSCTHGPGGRSNFVGPNPKSKCFYCQIKFDDATGLYVRTARLQLPARPR